MFKFAYMVGGWVGVARCLRNQKITEKNSSEKEHLENEKKKSEQLPIAKTRTKTARYQDQK